MPAGYVPPEKQHVFGLLAALGVELPAGAQIWGPRGDGIAWRVVDKLGRPLGITSIHHLKELQGHGPEELSLEDGRLVLVDRTGPPVT